MLELQDVFKKFGIEYIKNNNLHPDAIKAIYSIINCRTANLNGHMDVCHDCGAFRIAYNSCKNRNCPKCGNLKKEQWILDRKAEILPVPCFHTVFTVPDSLNPLFLFKPSIMYNILFQAASQTLIKLSFDKKYLGAQIGVTMVLHTWGQNLSFHPHVHCIIPGGGLTSSELFVRTKNDFFIPVKVLSKVFRGKFLSLLADAFREEKFVNFKNHSNHYDDKGFNHLLQSLYSKDWVVYCKKPFKNSDCVVEYLSRYTHKTAIYNKRLVSMDDKSISFKWRDYKDNKVKVMTLDANEFIRRFLVHILPSGFQKIRYFGLLSNRNRTTKLQKCFKLLNKVLQKRIKLSARDLILKLHGVDITICKHCGGQWSPYKTLYAKTG